MIHIYNLGKSGISDWIDEVAEYQNHILINIVTFKEDISKRIEADFGEESDKAFKALNDTVEAINYIETDRIIRCIIFLADGNIEALNKYIYAAIIDPRDVMLWAEYEYSGGDFNYKRLRDFNKTFDEMHL